MRKPQLFLLHFAGGNRYSFQFMTSLLNDFEVVPLELPGRGRRVSEGLLKDFDLAARDIYNRLNAKLTNSRFMIYGHSMGAHLALRVSNLLEKTGNLPAKLIVSGNAGPGIGEKKTTYLLEQKKFIEKVESLGGLPPELKTNDELFDFFEPILRADFEIAEKNNMAFEPATKASLYAIMGSKEEHVDEILNWRRFTHSEFDYEILEGGHFFIHKHPARIAGIIRDCYNKTVLPEHF